MTKRPVYLVVDGEFDGPVPGQNSMLSFAAVAVTKAGEWLGEFEAVLESLPGATRDPQTMKFWDTQPEAFAAATESPRQPSEIMPRFVDWVRALPGDVIFASHPLALDGIWFDFYMRTYANEPLLEGPWIKKRLFKGALCMVSYAAGRLGRSGIDSDEEDYPDEWCGNVPHTHRAIDDARGYAHLMHYLLNLKSA